MVACDRHVDQLMSIDSLWLYLKNHSVIGAQQPVPTGPVVVDQRRESGTSSRSSKTACADNSLAGVHPIRGGRPLTALLTG